MKYFPKDKKGLMMAALGKTPADLAITNANLVNVFNPSSLIINTGDFTDCPTLLSIAEKNISERAFNALTASLKIIRVTSDDDTTVCGMAHNLCDRIFDINCPDNIIE